MAPRPMPWFRYYSESKQDVKLTKAARLAGVSQMEIVGFWVTLLCIANESPVRGALYVTLHDRYNIDDVTAICNAPIEMVKKVMAAFEALEMITVIDGAWHITNWDKRQFSSDKSAKRVQEYRKKTQCNNNVTLHGRYSNGDVTPPDTESYTDTDTEIKEGGAMRPPPNGKVSKPKAPRDIRLDHPAIKAYRGIVHLQVPEAWREDVIEVVGDRLDEWRELLKAWIGKGWNKQNISGMLDAFKKAHPPARTGKKVQIILPDGTISEAIP